MDQLFTFIDSSIKGTPLLALSISFLWGVLSVLLSPCHLSSVPLIVGFMSGKENLTFKKAFITSSLFASGILITIALLGVFTMIIGFAVFSRIGIWGNATVALVFFVVGLNLLEILPIPFLSNINRPMFEKRGYIASFILGLIFGLTLGPCTFAYMMPVLSVASANASSNIPYASSLILLYAIGHCVVIVLAGSFFEIVEHYLKWNEKSKAVILIKKICGVLVIVAGVYLLMNTMKLL